MIHSLKPTRFKRPPTAIAAAVSLLASNALAETAAVSSEWAVPQIKKVSAEGSFRINTERRSKELATVTVNSDQKRCIDVQFEGDTLKLVWEEDQEGCGRQQEEVLVILPLAEYSALNFSGAVTFKAQELKTGSLTVRTSGAAEVELAGDFESIDLRASGASGFELSGKLTKELSIDSSGATKVNAENLEAKSIRVDTSGSAKIALGKGESLSVSASGASKVTYKGTPKITRKNLSGLSSLSSTGE